MEALTGQIKGRTGCWEGSCLLRSLVPGPPSWKHSAKTRTHMPPSPGLDGAHLGLHTPVPSMDHSWHFILCWAKPRLCQNTKAKSKALGLLETWSLQFY